MTHPLDDPVGLALRGQHAPYAVSAGTALRYHPEIGPFAALAPDPAPGDWADLGELLGPAGGAALLDPPPLPVGWSVLATFPALQMVGPQGEPPTVTDGPQVVALQTAQDRVDGRDLAKRTEPGPFESRTMELGAFLGVRDEGRLVAMAGERMKPPGWTEVSAVCTDPSVRGRGLASLLVAAVSDGIRARGDRPYLHVLRTNTAATRVYAALGFTVRREVDIIVVRPPH